MKKNNISAAILILVILFSLFPSAGFGLEARVFFVNNENDLIQLAEDCTLDSYSQGLMVLLTRDIQITDQTFRGIPTFGGTFNGNNHMISGVSMSHEGSTYGLFRYVQTSGIVQNLRVEAALQLTGTENRIGGIAGENRGIIENCTVSGRLSGKSHIGGIVAKNEATGQVIDCRFSGTVTGENFSGGIVGENYGLIKNSANTGSINTTVTPSTLHLEDISLTQINETESIITSTNTGGITGFNRGIIEGCTNDGIVGYPHVGYNIGGIAGRQDGYINASVNHGSILGRKDVGGIVGQMEPYQVIKSDEDFFRELEEELDTLEDTINAAYDQVDLSNDAVSSQFEDVNRAIANVSDRMEILSDRTVDYADENIETINKTLNRIHAAVVDLEGATAELQMGAIDVSRGLEDMNAGFICMSMSADAVEKGFSEINDAFADIGMGMNEINKGAKEMEEGFNHLDAAVSNNESLDQAIDEINHGLDAINDGMVATLSALNKMADILSAADDPLHADLGEIIEKTKDDLESAQASFNLAADEMKKALIHLKDEYEKDAEEISLAMTYFRQAFSYFQTGLDYLNMGIADFSDASVYFESASKMMGFGMDNFAAATQDFKRGSDHLTMAIHQINQTLEREAALGAPQFSLLGESIDAAKKELFVSGDKLAAEMSKLNQVSKDTVESITDDLRAINNQIFVVIDLIKKGYQNSMDKDREIFNDISDEEILEADANQFANMAPTFGYVVNCLNDGEVNGDINIGGITGTLAIDYDFDPEGDLTAKESNLLNFQFQTKGVLAECNNTGLVTAKKDYAGGIVGRMDLGSLFGCFNNSSVLSSDGNYVGGIAGGSYSVIRNSYSLSRLSGFDYVGGITGFGTEIIGCTSMTTIDHGVEFIGMIAGDVQDGMTDETTSATDPSDSDESTEKARIANNRFVGNEWAAIDGISYSTKAEPFVYATLLEDDSLPSAFQNLTLTFVADGQVIATRPFAYQGSLTPEELPEVPEKPGCIGNWPDYDYTCLTFPDTIVADYTPLKQVLASEPSDGPAELLVEGVFSPDASVSITVNQTIGTDLLTDMTKIGQWQLAVSNNQEPNESYTYHVYAPNHEHDELYAWMGSKWQQLDTVSDGSYLVFQWPTEELTFCIYEKGFDYKLVAIPGILILCFSQILVIRRRRRKRLAK